MLVAGADRLCGDRRYEHNAEREHTRAGSSCRQKPAKSACRCRSRGICHSRRPSANVIRARSPPSKSPDRDVLGGRERTTGRGHHRGAVAHAGIAVDGQRTEPEDLGEIEQGGSGRSRAATPTSAWIASGRIGVGAAWCAMSACWRSASMPRASARCWASAKGPRKTRRAGRRSCGS